MNGDFYMSLWLYLPAALSLLVKVLIFLKREKIQFGKALSAPFWLLVCHLAMLNVIEILGYYYMDFFTQPNLELATGFLKLYYICLGMAISLLLEISIIVAAGRSIFFLRWGNFVFSISVMAFIAIGDSVIAGAQSIGYTMTRVPGEYFVVGPLFATSMLLFCVVVCFFGYVVA